MKSASQQSPKACYSSDWSEDFSPPCDWSAISEKCIDWVPSSSDWVSVISGNRIVPVEFISLKGCTSRFTLPQFTNHQRTFKMKYIYKSTTFTILFSLLLACKNSDATENVPSGSPFTLLKPGVESVGAPATPEKQPAPSTPSKVGEGTIVHPEVLSKEQEKNVFPATEKPGDVPKAEVAHPVTTPQQVPQVQKGAGGPVAKAIAQLTAKQPTQVTEPVASDVPQAPPLVPTPQTPVKAKPPSPVTAPPSGVPETPPLAKTGTELAPVPQHARKEPSIHLPTYLSPTQPADPVVYEKVITAALSGPFKDQVPSMPTIQNRFFRLVSWNVNSSKLGGDASQKLGKVVNDLVKFRPSVLMLQQLPLAKNELQEEIADRIKVELGLSHIEYCQDAKTLTGLLIASKHPLVDGSNFRYILNEKEGDCFALRSALTLSLGKEYEPLTVNLANVNLNQSVITLSSQLEKFVPKLQPVSSSPLVVAGTTNRATRTLSASLLEPVFLKSVYSALHWNEPGMTSWNGEVVDHAYVTDSLGGSLLGAYEGASLDSDHLPLIVDFDLATIAKKKAVGGVTSAQEKGTTGKVSTSKPATSPPVSSPSTPEAAKGKSEQGSAQKKKSFFGKNAAASSMNNAIVLSILMVGALILLN